MSTKVVLAVLAVLIIVAVVVYVLLRPDDGTDAAYKGLTRDQKEQKDRQIKQVEESVRKMFERQAQQTPTSSQRGGSR